MHPTVVNSILLLSSHPSGTKRGLEAYLERIFCLGMAASKCHYSFNRFLLDGPAHSWVFHNQEFESPKNVNPSSSSTCEILQHYPSRTSITTSAAVAAATGTVRTTTSQTSFNAAKLEAMHCVEEPLRSLSPENHSGSTPHGGFPKLGSHFDTPEF